MSKLRTSKSAVAIVRAIVAVLLPAFAMANDIGIQSSPEIQQSATHMSEEVRASVSKIVILASEGQSGEAVTGDYEKSTPGLLGGMADGSGIGTIPVEVGGVPIGIPIPVLREIGMIVGAISGSAQREIQDFRDALTEDLKDAVDQPLSNDSLANDVYWGLRNVSSVQPKILALTTPVPEDTEALLFVALSELTINVQEDEAIIATTATARLQRRSDGVNLYRREVTYEDRDTLKNWMKDDAVLWREYRSFARHYLGREISAELYERVELSHELTPAKSKSLKPVKNRDWQVESKSLRPTLVWNLELSGGSEYGEWVNNIDPSSIAWDLEIYDAQRPVYTAKQFNGASHTPDMPLEACKVYRWTVRPTYHVDGVRKNGEWMRLLPEGADDNGNVGRVVSEAHAYIQDFPSFKTSCRLK